jgi:hypothetical protein
MLAGFLFIGFALRLLIAWLLQPLQ